MKDDVLELIKKHSEDNIGEGTSEVKIEKLEEKLNIQLPKEYRNFLKKIGYAEIFGDEIYSIYGNEDVPCLGIYYQNRNNEDLKKGYLKFYSNDIDGVFYINIYSGEISLNSIENKFAKSFNQFILKMINS